MNRNVWLGKKNLRFYIYRYKDSPYYSLGIWSFVALACILLLVKIVIPQFSMWFSIRKEIEATQQKISIVKSNINFMNNIDKTLLDQQFQTAARALPPERNFEEILNALSDAALLSGVSFDDFSFQLGTIDSSSHVANNQINKDIFMITISLVVRGSVDKVTRFLRELASKTPISEVTYINGSGELVSLRIQFYQKPFPKVSLQDEEPLVAVSNEKNDLLKKLATWKSGQAQLFQPAAQNASSSATVPLF